VAVSCWSRPDPPLAKVRLVPGSRTVVVLGAAITIVAASMTVILVALTLEDVVEVLSLLAARVVGIELSMLESTVVCTSDKWSGVLLVLASMTEAAADVVVVEVIEVISLVTSSSSL